MNAFRRTPATKREGSKHDRPSPKGVAVRTGIRRRVLVPALAAGLIASALGSAPASSELDPTLPSLNLEQLLAIARVDAPPAGIGLEIHADFPTENPLTIGGIEFTALTAVINPDRSVDMQSAVAARGTDSGDAVGECTDPTFAPTGRSWGAEDMPVEWRFDVRSTPPAKSKFFTRRSIRLAHTVWPHAVTRCADSTTTNFDYLYKGETRRKVKYDQTNIVEFGPLGSGALAINYTWFSGTRILETDLRLNRGDYRWTNRREGTGYQVRNVTAHELGHQVGLDDLGDPHSALTMFGRISRGELKKTTLGSGDLRGAERLSP